MSNDKLVQALRDLLAKVRQDAPDLSGKLLGYCDAVLAEHDAKNQGRPAAGWIPGWSFDTNKLVAALERQGIAVPQKDRRDDGVVLWDARTARYVFVSSYRDWREAEKQAVEHRPGCDALGGYGHGVGVCNCGSSEAEKQAGPVALPQSIDLPEDWRERAAGSALALADPETWARARGTTFAEKQAGPVAWMRDGWGPDCGPYIEFYRDDEMGWRDRKDWVPLYTAPPSESAAPVKPPKHKFWGAGEPDCPADLKAPNGELHSRRCKVCGETNPRDQYCWNAAPLTEQTEPVAYTVAGEVTNWARDFSKYRTQHYVRPVYLHPSPLTEQDKEDAELTEEEIKRVHDHCACLPDLVGLKDQWPEVLRFAREVLRAARAKKERS